MEIKRSTGFSQTGSRQSKPDWRLKPAQLTEEDVVVDVEDVNVVCEVDDVGVVGVKLDVEMTMFPSML
jgi:hypothetical protein